MDFGGTGPRLVPPGTSKTPHTFTAWVVLKVRTWYTPYKDKGNCMEFDQNSPISDEQRRLAETKRVTLRPLHANIMPEDTPDAEIAAKHAADPAIGNIAIDTEQNQKSVQPTKSALKDHLEVGQTPRTGAVVITIVIAITIVGIAAASLFLTRQPY